MSLLPHVFLSLDSLDLWKTLLCRRGSNFNVRNPTSSAKEMGPTRLQTKSNWGQDSIRIRTADILGKVTNASRQSKSCGKDTSKGVRDKYHSKGAYSNIRLFVAWPIRAVAKDGAHRGRNLDVFKYSRSKVLFKTAWLCHKHERLCAHTCTSVQWRDDNVDTTRAKKRRN